MEENDKGSLLEKARERLTEVGDEVSRLKTEASQAVEDRVVTARRLAKRGRYAAEDLIDEAAHRIKGDRLRSGRTDWMDGDASHQRVSKRCSLRARDK
jgi:hypothetical protein